MPKKKKISLVLEVCLSDRESFKIIPDKKQQKNIYDKIRNRLVRKGLEGELLKNEMVAEIRQELFRLQPQFKPKESGIKEENQDETDFFDRKSIRIRGFDVWGENSPEIDPIDQLERNYNRSVQEGFRDVFCPRCKSNPCVCRIEGDE